jgi:hypothetical protein
VPFLRSLVLALGMLLALGGVWPAGAATPDPRIGVTHISGLYPQVGDGFLLKGAQEISTLGFKTIELYLSPETCWTSSFYPQGRYQTQAWCNEKTLTAVAGYPQYRAAFALPFQTIFLTTEPMGPSAATTWRVKQQTPFTQSELDLAYREYYDLTRYLATTYTGSGKRFIYQTPNEMDWQMLTRIDLSLDPSDQQIANAVTYWNNVQRAVDDARRDQPPVGMNVYHGCEVNLLKKAMAGGKTATNNVLPQTHCDLYGYSSWDTADNQADTFVDALAYLAAKAPDSAAFGAANVYVSELGVAEQDLGTAAASALLAKRRSQALAFGVPYVLYWQVYDGGCKMRDPRRNSQCPGLWLRKPDGSLSDLYGVLAP